MEIIGLVAFALLAQTQYVFYRSTCLRSHRIILTWRAYVLLYQS